MRIRNVEKDPFSPRDRSVITKLFIGQLKANGKTAAQYNASKHGQDFELRWNAVKANVWWRVCIDRVWIEGEDIDIFHALDSVGHKIAFKLVDRRLAREAAAVA